MLTPTFETGFADRLFSNIDFSHGAIVAISGGSDSTALLILLKDYLDRVATGTKLVAVTIDHDLRAGSTAEAAEVENLCVQYGISHRTLVWSGEKPSTGIPAAAREARYRLLAKAARQEGIGVILTGHTADDQVETVMMRQSRSQANIEADGRGLSGMAPATLYDGAIWIVRPLLTTRREALRAMLRANGARWIDDPTNLDTRFERPRIRATVGVGGDAHFDEILARTELVGDRRLELGRVAAGMVEAFAGCPIVGLVRLDPAFAKCLDRAGAIYVLRVLLAAVGGTPFLPDHARAEHLFEQLGTGPSRATLSRVIVDIRGRGIFLHRETRGLPSAVPLGANRPVEGHSYLWDGRRQITFSNREPGLVIAPVGLKSAVKLAENLHSDDPPSLIRAALAAEPALWRGEHFLGLLADGVTGHGVVSNPAVAPWVHFLPSFDLALAGRVAALLGAPPVAGLPFYVSSR